MKNSFIDIHSKGGYPSSALSNFAKHKFTVDGIRCGSMEGFLQSLKYKNRLLARSVAKKSGKRAKRAGDRRKGWRRRGVLYWKGKKYERLSPALSALIRRAYEAMFRESSDFRAALGASMGYTLTHSLGKSDPFDTVLTEGEFIGHLNHLRRNCLSAKVKETK